MIQNHYNCRVALRYALTFCMCLIGFSGCAPKPPTPVAFEPNYLYSHRLAVSEELSMEQFLADSEELLLDWFGTPDAPKLPKVFEELEANELISLDRMRPAVGPPANIGADNTVSAESTGLYRQLCVSCHGETGQGRGPVAASQNPYPRDFRKGVFKYKDTYRNSKPLRADLARTLRHGLEGSQMPKFDTLSQPHIDALIDYVIFLSVRGEFERKLLAMGATDLDPEFAYDSDPAKRERIYDVSYRDSKVEAESKAFAEQLSNAEELLTEIVESWQNAEDQIDDIELPDDMPVFGANDDSNKEDLEASITKGRQLFVGGVAACSKCHGESAKGDGPQLPDYDEWTKEWTAQINILPNATDELLPFMARGGMKPQPIAPRNLVEGKFRGGRDSIAVYKKILYGIAGGPMPAAAMSSKPGEPGLTKDDVWHIVNYVLSLRKD